MRRFRLMEKVLSLATLANIRNFSFCILGKVNTTCFLLSWKIGYKALTYKLVKGIKIIYNDLSCQGNINT